MDFKILEEFLLQCIKKKIFPGAVCWVGDLDQVYYFEAYGDSQIVPEKRLMTRDTVFDLASLTKPLCTATLMIKLYEEGKVRLEDKISHFIPEFKNSVNGEKTIKGLLTHTTGIPAWFPLYLLARDERWDFLARVNTGSHNVLYSCLGYIILGRIIETVSGDRLDVLFEKKIKKMLGLNQTHFNPKTVDEVAPTELGNSYEQGIARKYGDIKKVPWRNYLIKGEVHDGNAFYCFQGVAGNAGLFSNATDLAELIRSYLAGDIVSNKNFRMMIQTHACNEEKRGLGWVVDSYPGVLPGSTFGHTGFTGTMLLVVPENNLIIILLTNAVHPEVRLNIMMPIRQRVVQLISEIMGLHANR